MNEIGAIEQCSGANMARREKSWDELTDSEKIERMRQEVKRLQRLNDEQARKIMLLQEHQHMPDGRLVVAFNLRGSLVESDYRRGGEWF